MNKRIFTLFFMLLLVSAGFAQKHELDYGKMIMDTTELKKTLPLVDQLLAKRGETRYVIPSFVPFRTRYQFYYCDKKYYNGLTFSKELYEKAMEGDVISQLKVYFCTDGGFLDDAPGGISSDDMLTELVKSENPDAKYIYYRIKINTNSEPRSRQRREKFLMDMKELADNYLYGPACYYLYEKGTFVKVANEGPYRRMVYGDGKDYSYLWSALLAKYPQAYYTAGRMAIERTNGAVALWYFNEAKKLGWDFTENEDEEKDLYNAQSLVWYQSANIKDNEKWFRRYRFDKKSRSLGLDVDNLYRKLASADSTFKKENSSIYANIFAMYVSDKVESLSEIKRYKALKELDRMAKNGNMYAQACIGELYWSDDYPNIIECNRSLGVSLMASAVDYGLTEIAQDVALKYKQIGNQEKYLKYLAINDPQEAERMRKENAGNADNPELFKKLAGTWRKDANSYPIITFDAQGNCELYYVIHKSQLIYNNWTAKYTITSKGHATYRATQNGKIYLKSLKFDPDKLTINNKQQLPQTVINEVNNNALKFAPAVIETHLQSGEFQNNTLTLGGLAPFHRVK